MLDHKAGLPIAPLHAIDAAGLGLAWNGFRTRDSSLHNRYRIAAAGYWSCAPTLHRTVTAHLPPLISLAQHVALRRPGSLLPDDVCRLLHLRPARLTQNSSALNETARRATKSNNTRGSPIKLPSKILAIVSDPQDEHHVYVAEAAGNLKRINLKVGQTSYTRLLGLWLMSLTERSRIRYVLRTDRTPHIRHRRSTVGHTIRRLLGQVDMVVDQLLAEARQEVSGPQRLCQGCFGVQAAGPGPFDLSFCRCKHHSVGRRFGGEAAHSEGTYARYPSACP